jgi:hypothetical protein
MPPRSPTKAAAAGFLVDRTATALLVVTAHSLACVTGEEEENERSVVFEWIHVRHSSPYVSEISKKQQLPFSPVKTWSD